MDIGLEIIRDQLFFRKELRERVYWFIQLRWAAVAAGLAGAAATHWWDLPLPLTWLLGVVGFIALYNAALMAVGRGLVRKHPTQVRPFALFAHLQICLDLLALALLVLPTGGQASPLAIFFFFHVVMAGVLLNPASSFSYAGVVMACLGLTAAWQQGLLGAAWPQAFSTHVLFRPPSRQEAVGLFLIYAAGLFTAAYLVSSVKVALRFKGRELMKVSRELEASNVKLASLYDMIKEVGGHQTLQRMLDAATKNAARLMGVKACSIKLLDPELRCLRFASTHGLSEDYLSKDCISVDKSPINRQIIEKSLYSIGHIDEENAFQYPEDVRREGIASMLCLPLEVDKKVLGVFCVYSGQSHFFKDADAGFFSLMSDLTALALERQAREEAKTWFMNKSAHQLRSPLGAIKSMLDILAGGYQGQLTPDQGETVSRCRQRVGMLQETINDLLKLAAGRQTIPSQTQRVDLAPALEALRDVYQTAAAQKGLDLAFRLGPDLPLALGRPDLLDDLMTNLVGNAIKYTPAGGRVEVSLRPEPPGWLVFEVADTGIGIPPADLARLGQEFFRAENARQAAEEGTGLGLVIVKEILARLGGELAVQSQVGQGTRMTCRLPAAPA